MLEEEIAAIGAPQEKFSKNLLNMKMRLKKYIQAKKYAEAKIMREDVEELEEKELMMLEENHQKAMDKLRENKMKKQMSEYESIKARLEKNINSKLKQRMDEYEKLLLRIQNVHNDMSAKQTKEFNKIQSIHAKLLAKYNLDLDSIRDRQEYLREGRSVMNNESEKSQKSSLKNDFQPSINQSSQKQEPDQINSDDISNSKDMASIEAEEIMQDEVIEMSNSLSTNNKSNQEIEEIPIENDDKQSENMEQVKNSPYEQQYNEYTTQENEETTKKTQFKEPKKSFDSDDLVEPEDNVKGFNNFYRVQTKHFPSEESSEDEDK